MQNLFKIEKLLLTLYSFLACSFLGWQIMSFFSVYFQSSEKRIQSTLSQWLDVQNLYLPVVVLCCFILIIAILINKNIRSGRYILNQSALIRQVIFLGLLILGKTFNYIFSYLHLTELFNMTFAFLSLFQLSKVFYVKDKLAWYHPTTQGTIYIAAALLGISQILIFNQFKEYSYEYIILILLIIEAFRLTARFRFLTKTSYETNMIARLLLGRYGIYFGVRVIAGIFMPIAYTIYSMISNAGLLQGVGTLILIGEFLEKILFTYISDYQKIDKKS